MPLHDPVPPEPEPPVSGNGPPAPGDGVHPTPLSPTGVAFLHQSLARQQRRRQGYRAGPLRVLWDGAAHGQMDPTVGVGEPFRVPLKASYVEIVGDDAEGALLLAVVPLPDPEEMEGDGVEHLAVTLEGGQTVTVAIALEDRSGGKARAYVIQVVYTEPTAGETPGAEPSAVAELLPKPHDPGEAWQLARAQLIAETRRVQAEAKDLCAMINPQLQQVRQLRQELRGEVRGLRALDRPSPETLPRDAP
jgi:hypothetical protein